MTAFSRLSTAHTRAVTARGLPEFPSRPFALKHARAEASDGLHDLITRTRRLRAARRTRQASQRNARGVRFGFAKAKAVSLRQPFGTREYGTRENEVSCAPEQTGFV